MNGIAVWAVGGTGRWSLMLGEGGLTDRRMADGRWQMADGGSWCRDCREMG